LNSILYGTSLKHTTRLQRIQHAAARVVLYQHSRTSPLFSNELLKQLYWLPIEWRIWFKLGHHELQSSAHWSPAISFWPPATSWTQEVSALIQFPSALWPPPQINIWILCFSVFCSKSLEFITFSIHELPTFRRHLKTFYFQSAHPLWLPILPRISSSTCPDSSKDLGAI